MDNDFIEISYSGPNRLLGAERKNELEKSKAIHCGYCPYHRNENVKRNSRFVKKHGRNDRYKDYRRMNSEQNR